MFPEIFHLMKYLTIPLSAWLAATLSFMRVDEELGTQTSITALA